MKRILSLISILSLCLVFLFSCNGDDKCKLAYELSEDGTYYTITGIGAHEGEDVIIPDEIDGIPVKVIKESAFDSNASITSVTLGKNIEEIGRWAFSGCTSLTEINWNAAKLTKVGDRAFYGIENAITLNVGASAEVFPSNAFLLDARSGEATKISKINIAPDSSLVEICANAFNSSSSLTSINLENATKLEKIGANAFYGCSSLTDITIPASVKEVGANAFFGCSGISKVNTPSLESWLGINFATIDANPASLSSVLYVNGEPLSDLVVPESVKIIGSNVFANNLYLKSVVLHENVTSIHDSFVGCANLTSITFNCASASTNGVAPFSGASSFAQSTKIKIGKSVTSIPASMFENMPNLTEVDFSEATSLVSIGAKAFKGNSNLATVSLPASLNSMNYDSFEGCDKILVNEAYLLYIDNWLVSVSDRTFSGVAVPRFGTTHIADGALASCRSLYSVYLPSSIKVIGNKAFYDCAQLVKIEIPSDARIEYIGKDAFLSCSKITTVKSSLECWTGITFASKESNPLFNGCKLTINGSDGAFDFTTDKDVFPYAFVGCQNLSSVTVNGSVEIGKEAFYRSSASCVSLTNVKKIGENAFAECASLLNITIDSDAIYIADSVFDETRALSRVDLNAKVRAQNSSFNNAGVGGTGFVLTLGAKSSNLPANLFTNATTSQNTPKITRVYVEEGVTSLTCSFKNITTISEVSLPEGLTEIGDNVFCGCTSLIGITFPSTLTKIGENAFSKSKLFGDIVIPDSVTEIATGAFSSTDITSVTLPASLKTLSDSAFSNCATLECEITLPEGLTTIGKFAFMDSPITGTLVIPATVTTISESPFWGTKLTKIEVKGQVKNLDNAFKMCESLQEVSLPEGVTSLKEAFWRCRSIDFVYVPSTVTNIDGAFFECTALKTVYLTGDLLSIGASTFQGCSSLTTIKIPSTVTKIEARAFANCSSLKSIELPSALASIGEYAFAGAASLKELVIPSSVTSLGEYALSGCSSLERLTLPSIKKNIFIGNGGGLFSAFDYTSEMATNDGMGGVRYCWPTTLTEITITSSDICKNALVGSNALQKVTVSCEEIAIADSAFSGCWAMEYILDGKLVSIGEKAFYSSYLSKLTVKEWATDTIPDYAFASAKELYTFTVPSCVKHIGVGAFENAPLTSLTFEDPLDWTVTLGEEAPQPISLMNPNRNAGYAMLDRANYKWDKAN